MITSVLAPLRPAARIFTGSTYVLLGFDALRAPGARVEQAGPVLAAVRKAVPLPEDDELVVRANAAVQVLCGALLMAGRAPRLASLALAGSLIPTTLAGHSYWALEDPATRKPAIEMGRETVRRCEDRGLLVQARGSHSRTNVIRLVPPMVCTDAEIDEGLAILEEVFAALARDRRRTRSIAAE